MSPAKQKTTKKPLVSEARLRKAQNQLGYWFKDTGLLALALCHASTKNEGLPSNERLEFLGDAVLTMLVSWFLHEGLRDADEGTLSTRRSQMTSGEALAQVAQRLKLGAVLKTGKGQDLEPTASMQADVVEACIGAMFLDGGLEAAQQFVIENVISPHKPDQTVYNDPKSRLQHYTLSKRLGLPEYRLVEAKGPGHAQEFTMEVVIGDRALGQGSGTSKKSAQQQAATVALEALKDLALEPANGQDQKKSKSNDPSS